MIRKLHLSLLLLFLCNTFVLAQNTGLNNSFVHTNFLTTSGDGIGGMTKTKDNGFAYTWAVIGSCAIDTSYTKFDENSKCCKGCNYDPAYSKFNRPECLTSRTFLFKCDEKGKIQWVKSIYNECYSIDIIGKGGHVEQTSDGGFLCYRVSQIVKTDNLGNIKWKLYFDRDSIPGIKKSRFLSEAGISDIYECSDGSFIALLEASFSLLKISKDGKPLWLKSTLFDEFSPMTFEYFENNLKDIKRTDSILINWFEYKQGGGVYVPTNNVYETDDGGYMAIGQNKYRYKDFISDFTFSAKTFCIIQEIPKKKSQLIIVPRPEKIYGIRQYSLNEKEKAEIPKRKTTVVVKTDKNGKVEWTKQFGIMSYDDRWRSDLVKLANGKWLVRIRDCSIQGTDSKGNNNYCCPGSKDYLIDNNGNNLQLPYSNNNKFQVDPWGMSLAPDSGYYFYEQNIVSKADKNMVIQWQKGFGGWLQDEGIHAVTADTGVISTERGVIYKYDKFGNSPSTDVSIDVVPVKLHESAYNKSDSTYNKPYLHFILHSNRIDQGILEIKRTGNRTALSERNKLVYVFEGSDEYKDDVKMQNVYKATHNEKWNVPFSTTNVGKWDNVKQTWILDISDTCELNAFFLNNSVNSPAPDEIEIKEFQGYKEFYTSILAKGEYNYKLTDRKTEEVLCKGTFTWDPKELMNK